MAHAAFVIVPEPISKEEEKEQGLIMKPKVLGQEVEELKMQFYEETKVLGKQLAAPVEPAPRLPEKIFHTYEKLIEDIFMVWGILL